jgi:mRNA-degrading endonuclease toxin of MazEF toxin-antitoxin module
MPVTTGSGFPLRGEVWWVRTDKRRPAIVLQSDKVGQPRVRSFLVVPLTSRLHLSELPGNLRLETRATRLAKASVANVYDLQKVAAADFLERVSILSRSDLDALEAGVRLVLDL